ncbi:MAG: SUMF1/EgtB/PvdO family nonheme iron enzyme [Gemmatimonadota bacterium]
MDDVRGPLHAVVGGRQRPGSRDRLLLAIAAGLAFALAGVPAAAQEPAERFTNSIGMELVRIEPGSFTMGETNRIPGGMLEEMTYLTAGDWDERPAHRVEIGQPYWIGVTEVTLDQYRQFDPGYPGSGDHAPYVTGVSWYEARAFTEWLSEKEGKPYRLPTEAEWEYAARAGSTTLFWAGDAPPEPGAANPWGLENVHSGVAEWVLDWHGAYPHEQQVDPVGRSDGVAKVVRGGGLDRRSPYYARSANRAGMAPDFPPAEAREQLARMALADDGRGGAEPAKDTPAEFREPEANRYADFVRDVLGNQGNHPIGLRVVQAPLPETLPMAPLTPFFQRAVKQTAESVEVGPPADRPYLRKRRLLPIPPENTPIEKLDAIQTAGFHPGILRHQHSPALEVAPNGDLIAIYYTSVDEVTPDVALLATRLRFGADAWDMPSFFIDFPDVDDHAPMLWLDSDSLRFFWGANKLDSGFPFQWTSSGDNGATWTEVSYPVFETPVGTHSAQPITSAFRDSSGAMYVASDGEGPESVLWISRNDGRTWIDPGGRTGGRHTAFVLLEDGRILGMGGKSSDIEGFMPKSISSDGGKTWTVSKSPFPSLGSNQRPTVLRLASGRLFFAGDLQRRDGFQPDGFDERGAYVALSDDEGETWTIKRLPGAEEHESAERRAEMRGETIGYSVARQAPNGVIHLITSMNEQALHFALNEAWILATDGATPVPGAATRTAPAGPVTLGSTATGIADVRSYEGRDEGGRLRATWSGGIADDGRWLLHGPETWFHPDGGKQWEVTWEMGRKMGRETFWRADGSVLWAWDHRADGSHVWTRYWPNGEKRSESTWRDMRAEGEAVRWNPAGEVVSRVTFQDGVPVD